MIMKITSLIRENIRESLLLLENYDVLQRYFDRGLQELMRDPQAQNDIAKLNRELLKYTDGDYGVKETVQLYKLLVQKNVQFDSPEYKNAGFWIKMAKEDNTQFVFGLISLVYATLKKLDYNRKKKQEESDYDVIFKSSNLVVFKPNTTAASCKLGKGTRWCTAADHSNMFDQYSSRGELYYFHTRLSRPHDKLAAFVYDNGMVEFFDSSDSSMNRGKFKTILLNTGTPVEELKNINIDLGLDFSPLSEVRTWDRFADVAGNGYHDDEVIKTNLADIIEREGFGNFMQNSNFYEAFDYFGDMLHDTGIPTTTRTYADINAKMKKPLETVAQTNISRTVKRILQLSTTIIGNSRELDPDVVDQFITHYLELVDELPANFRMALAFIFGDRSTSASILSQAITIVTKADGINNFISDESRAVIQNAKGRRGESMLEIMSNFTFAADRVITGI